jgi:hypothetical protein
MHALLAHTHPFYYKLRLKFKSSTSLRRGRNGL